jgi:hypothetical protein
LEQGHRKNAKVIPRGGLVKLEEEKVSHWRLVAVEPCKRARKGEQLQN